MKRILVIASFLVLQGCAFTDESLVVPERPDLVPTGPLSEIDARAFRISPLADEREDKERIGYVKNGYGMKTADIGTETPVTDLVANAIADGLTNNGHQLGEGDVTVSGTITRFWIDLDMNFTNVEVFSDISVALAFTDSATDSELYSRTYSGHGSLKKGIVTKKVKGEVLALALSNLVEEIVLDEDLVEALEDARQARR